MAAANADVSGSATALPVHSYRHIGTLKMSELLPLKVYLFFMYKSFIRLSELSVNYKVIWQVSFLYLTLQEFNSFFSLLLLLSSMYVIEHIYFIKELYYPSVSIRIKHNFFKIVKSFND